MRELLIIINILVLLVPLMVSKIPNKENNLKKLEEVINYEEPCIRKIKERR